LVGVKTPETCALHRANELDADTSRMLRVVAKSEESGDDWVYDAALGHEIYLR